MFLLVATLPSVAVPSSEGKRESSARYAIEVDLRRRVTTLNVGKRAYALVSVMESSARDARMAMGSDKTVEPDELGRVLQTQQDNTVYQDAVKSSHVRGATRSMDEYSVKF